MKYQQFALVVLIAVIFSINCIDGQGQGDKSAKDHFQIWKLNHGKKYDNETHEAKKFQIWSKHKKNIDDHNSRFSQGLETYTKELHQHHDKTIEEFKKAFTGAIPPIGGKRDVTIIRSRAALPTSVNLTNLLPPVKDQGQCGLNI